LCESKINSYADEGRNERVKILNLSFERRLFKEEVLDFKTSEDYQSMMLS